MPRRARLTGKDVFRKISGTFRYEYVYPSGVRDTAIRDAYYGLQETKNIAAPLIRDALAIARRMKKRTIEVDVLADYVRTDADDAIVREDWRTTNAALRVLYHASPCGTARQRGLLLGVARDPRLVAAMAAAVRTHGQADPTWMAVLVAEGSEGSAEALAPHLEPELSEDRRWRKALQSYASSPAMCALLNG